jgi:outer membrane protein OmpA-like peptidoglycan-associated protein
MNQMHTHQSRYTLWTWIVAVILALFLLWMLLTGRGPSATCCSGGEAVTSSADGPAMPFSFSVTASTFSSDGDSTQAAWFAKVEDLKTWLSTGNGLRLEGDANQVTLSGKVDSEAEKVAKVTELQSLLGPEVMILNQLSVPPSAVVVPEPPEVAKLYFDTGKSALPEQAAGVLEPTIEWLISHPESKAVISGYHDARGNRESNQTLAKARAQASKDALMNAGVEESRIEMRKPVETEGTGNEEEARRVEVAIE